MTERAKVLQCVADNGDRFALDVSGHWLHRSSLDDEPPTFVVLETRPRPRLVRLIGLLVTSVVMYGVFWIFTRSTTQPSWWQEFCALVVTLLATVATMRWFGLRTD